ncbi:unnamed protein product [Closterium sp. NIES-64]|nr:unnamed protein product [Closterium sp. NIES-64]
MRTFQLASMHSLTHLTISACLDLHSLPPNLPFATALRHLTLTYLNFEVSLDPLSHLVSLERLEVSSVDHEERFPAALFALPSLAHVKAGYVSWVEANHEVTTWEDVRELAALLGHAWRHTLHASVLAALRHTPLHRLPHLLFPPALFPWSSHQPSLALPAWHMALPAALPLSPRPVPALAETALQWQHDIRILTARAAFLSLESHLPHKPPPPQHARSVPSPSFARLHALHTLHLEYHSGSPSHMSLLEDLGQLAALEWLELTGCSLKDNLPQSLSAPAAATETLALPSPVAAVNPPLLALAGSVNAPVAASGTPAQPSLGAAGTAPLLSPAVSVTAPDAAGGTPALPSPGAAVTPPLHSPAAAVTPPLLSPAAAAAAAGDAATAATVPSQTAHAPPSPTEGNAAHRSGNVQCAV